MALSATALSCKGVCKNYLLYNAAFSFKSTTTTTTITTASTTGNTAAFLSSMPLRSRQYSLVKYPRLTTICATRFSRAVYEKRPSPAASVNIFGIRIFDTRRWKYPRLRLPLARELDYIINHPIAEIVITALVVISCLGFALQTVNLGPFWNMLPIYAERSISSLFTGEYFLRWYARNLSPRFLFTRSMIIDFCAIVPLFIDLTIEASNSVFVRILRLTRIFRLQRMMEEEAKDMFGDMTEAQIRLANVALTVFSIIYVSAGLFFDVERGINPEVNTFFDAFYFATITLFTVGFGDVTPLTPAGRAVTVLTVLTGAVIIPFQLTEVERARKVAAQARQSALRIKDDLEVPSSLQGIIPFDFTAECKRCHLRGHQLDARFCRNCGLLLARRHFD